MKQILYFSTPTCVPCKMFGPVLIQTSSEIQTDLKKINAAIDKDLVSKYNITGVPTMILLRNGIEIKRHMGAMSKPDLLKFLK